jgi:hypothetical protein
MKFNDLMTQEVLAAREKFFLARVVPHELLEIRTSVSGAYTEYVVMSEDNYIDHYKVYGYTEDEMILV